MKGTIKKNSTNEKFLPPLDQGEKNG